VNREVGGRFRLGIGPRPFSHLTARTAGGYSFNGWHFIGSSIRTISAGSDRNGNAEVFAVNTQGSLFEQTERAGGSGYSSNGWHFIGSSITT
jgi:hypothetical protein